MELGDEEALTSVSSSAETFKNYVLVFQFVVLHESVTLYIYTYRKVVGFTFGPTLLMNTNNESCRIYIWSPTLLMNTNKFS
jgi:hypothetical protein